MILMIEANERGQQMPHTALDVVLTTLPCPVCHKTSEVRMTRAQFDAFEAGSSSIQTIFPDWPKDRRELLITGTHPACWELLWLPNEEDDEE